MRRVGRGAVLAFRPGFGERLLVRPGVGGAPDSPKGVQRRRMRATSPPLPSGCGARVSSRSAPHPMAKRRAEPLVCHVPCKRFVPRRLPRAEPAPRAAASKRKREAEAGEDEAPPGDAGGAGGRRRQQQYEGDAGSWRLQEAPEGGGGRGGARAAAELAEECFQYNSFQYWRAPLPTLQLSDIQDVAGENATKARIPSRPEIVETEMET